ncbi:MAG: cysteine--tRNA ligase, partial [Patescibacteria group bacterium]
SGYKVTEVMNITDVGHLTGDGDEGEDKLEKGALKSGKTVWEVAEFYTKFFLDTVKQMNILPPYRLVKATDHIEDMIQLIKRLQEKECTYETKEAIYFDISKFKSYGKLSGQKLEEKKQQAREDVHIDVEKKHPADFALWFKRVGRFANHTMHWSSPWGDGFPGWHIECSAMSMKYLGETIDIHAGGIDHIPVHHENEIAQSEAATGKPFAQIWFHNEFLLIDGKKMSKSLENFFTIDDVVKKGVEPMALRLLFLQTHYRKQMNFTWESAKAAREAYSKLEHHVMALKSPTQRTSLSQEKLSTVDELRKQFFDALDNDLQTPQAIAVMWEVIKSNIPSQDKLDLVLEFDQVLGLKLNEIQDEIIPIEIQELVNQREAAR